MVLGAGLGSDAFAREYSRFGLATDPRTLAEITDESLSVLRAAWTGRPVQHRGAHLTVDDVTFLPRPRRLPSIPVWIAGTGTAPRPRPRARGHQGFVPVDLTGPDQLAETVASLAPFVDCPSFDFVATLPLEADASAYAEAGATWCLRQLDPADPCTPAAVRARPPR